MVDSHFHVQLTAVLDVLMKTAVSDICAMAESWFKSLHTELARSKKENEDLRQKLQSLEQQDQLQNQLQAASESAQEAKITKEENEDSVSEVGDPHDSGCTVFAGTSTKDLSASALLWSSSSEEEFKKRKYSLAESGTAIRAHSSWSLTPVSTKAKMVDRYSTQCVLEGVEQKLDDTEENYQCFAPGSELKTEAKSSQPAPQSLECSFEVGSACENDSEECVVLEEVCETLSPRHRSEDKQQSSDICQWSPDLEPNLTQLLGENQSTSTNSNNRMTLNLDKDFNLAKAAKNGKHFLPSKGFSDSVWCEKGSTFTCNVCGKNLSTKNSLASHFRLHTREKPFMCTLCGKSFAKKFNLDIHYNIHTGAKPYTCTFCPKSFADPSAFRRHEWMHTRKSQQSACDSRYRLSCNTCGKFFLSKPSLSAHSQLHTTEKRQKGLF